MHVYALATVGVLALTGLLAAMVQLASHYNGRHNAASTHSSGHADGNQWPPDVAIDPLTGEALDALTAEEVALGQLDHGVESFAVHAEMFREYEGQHREETARQFWNAGFDWYINHLNRRFDALVADLPTTDSDPFPSSYWPVVSAVPVSGLPGRAGEPVTLQRLAAFSPEATIEIVEQGNATEPEWSWRTQEIDTGKFWASVQTVQHGATTLVREHPPRTHRHRR